MLGKSILRDRKFAYNDKLHQLRCLGAIVFLLIALSALTGCSHQVVRPITVADQQKSLELIDQGTKQLRFGLLSEARASFEVAKQLTGAAAAVDGLGCVSFLQGDYIGARDYFLEAYKRDSGYIESLSHLALLYDHLGEQDAAEQLYVRAVKEQPDDPLARNNYGALLEDQERSVAAEDEYYKAFALLPNGVIQQNIRGVLKED